MGEVWLFKWIFNGNDKLEGCFPGKNFRTWLCIFNETPTYINAKDFILGHVVMLIFPSVGYQETSF